jgi:hypothetical protein
MLPSTPPLRFRVMRVQAQPENQEGPVQIDPNSDVYSPFILRSRKRDRVAVAVMIGDSKRATTRGGYLLEMVVLEKRETQQISFFVRGLKAGGPADLSNLVDERVNYSEVTSVELASAPQGFHISVFTDRIEVKFFVHEDWRAQDAVDSLDAKLISSIDSERLGSVWIKYREQPIRL